MVDLGWNPTDFALLGQGAPTHEDGATQLAKALYRRLITYPGELPGHPEYGCRIRDYVGRVAESGAVKLAALEAERALRMDPRVRSVRVEASLTSQGTLLIEAWVEAQEPYGEVQVRVEVVGGR